MEAPSFNSIMVMSSLYILLGSIPVASRLLLQLGVEGYLLVYLSGWLILLERGEQCG